MINNRLNGNISRDLYVLEDENNHRTSKVEKVFPSTILDQVYDDQSPTKKNLRKILEELRQEIITGGRGNIKFPVTSVNNMTDDVIITKKHIGLGNVDNTKDIDKPLSSPQRNTIMEILSNYDFKINFDDLYSHLMNTDNPHDVRLDQIDKNEELTKFVRHHIGLHNTSQHNTIHPDIRGSLRRLWTLVDNINNDIDNRLKNIYNIIDDHMGSNIAHINVLDKKENLSNKVMEFNSQINSNHDKYPSTRAVVEFVVNKLDEFKDTLPNINHWIDNIKVVDKRSNLPRASINNFHEAYFIRYGNTSHPEIALCRMNHDNTYSWDFSYLGSYSKYDENYFMDTADGLSIRMNRVLEAILDTDGAMDRKLNDVLKEYYTITDIQNLKYIDNIKIISGTTDGTIRFYINDDIMTMSEDIYISGLKRLAYIEWVSEDEICDNAIHEHHIVSKGIARKHLQDKAVGKENIECPYGFIIGNDKNPESSTATYINLQELAEYLRPLIGGWPDPNVPGGNPWYDRLSTQLMQTHNWLVGTEYSFGNGGYGIRFTGTISCLANMDHKLILSQNLTTESGFQIIDAGGSWMYQSEPDVEWTIIGGSNITGHTFATVTMDRKGLYLETISIGNRIDAPFDIWVKYVKNKDLDKYPALPPNENI